MLSDNLKKMRKQANDIFLTSLKAVDPTLAVQNYLQLRGETLELNGHKFSIDDFENIYLVGFGKAAASMAKGVENVLGAKLTAGIVNVKYGHLDEVSQKIKINEAGHPVPDEAGIKGTDEIINLVQNCGETDLVVCVISGGGSAIFPSPQTGISLEEKQHTTKLLLSCGADITEINAIRKHISKVKGGQFARAVYPATLITLILSDVIGDPLDSIASGPTAPDNSTFGDCINILEKYELLGKIPATVENHLKSGAQHQIPETPKENDTAFEKTYNVIVGSNLQAVLAAKEKAEQLGYNTLILSTFVEGETKDVARVHAAIAKEIHKTGNPISIPACVISGGETTVTIKGQGKGGRNQEFVLAAAMDISNFPSTVMLSAGTDGTDGPTEAAGAIADNYTVERAMQKKLKPENYLKENDSYHFFEQLDDLIITGPTNTNVMDLRLILIR